MRQHRRLDDDDSPFDARGVIKDGRSLRVPLFAMDSMDPVQRAIAQSRITDGAGTTAGLHRPGFRVTDAKNARAAVEEAYRLRDEVDQNAWRADAKETWGEVGDECTVREGGHDEGSPGHLRRVGNRLVCVPDKPSKDELPTMDERAAAYQAYDEEVSNRWRGADR